MQKPYSPTQDLRILVVDDAAMILTMVTNLLASIGFRQITTADSVKSALEKFPRLEKCPFDAILLDLYLRDGTGINVIKAVRARDKDVPIIMLTQEDEAKKVVDIIAQGATDYIVKPFTEDLLIKKLERAFGRPL